MVDRFSQQFQDYGVIPSANGDFVRFSDYQKLEVKLAKERERVKELEVSVWEQKRCQDGLENSLAAAQATIAEMRSAWSDAKTKYVELLSSEDSEAAKLQAEGDMYGWNFHQGVRGGAVEFHINLTKLIRAITTPTNLDALHEARALECERLVDRLDDGNSDVTVEEKNIAEWIRNEAAAHRARKERA